MEKENDLYARVPGKFASITSSPPRITALFGLVYSIMKAKATVCYMNKTVTISTGNKPFSTWQKSCVGPWVEVITPIVPSDGGRHSCFRRKPVRGLAPISRALPTHASLPKNSEHKELSCWQLSKVPECSHTKQLMSYLATLVCSVLLEANSGIGPAFGDFWKEESSYVPLFNLVVFVHVVGRIGCQNN